MSDTLVLLPLGLAAAAAGATLAGRSQPACHWSSLSAIALKTRLSMLKRLPPSRRRAALAAAALAGLICAGALTAYAAEPSSPESAAPQRLASQAAGVIGSGDQLSLRVVEAGHERTIKPGEDYADGWKLGALTPTSATLVKDGERREVGLNPTGALASTQPATPHSRVIVTLSDAETLQKAIDGGLWDGKTIRPGLTMAQTQRYYTLTERAITASALYSMALNDRAVTAGLGPLHGVAIGNESAFAALLGPTEGGEYLSLLRTENTNLPSLAQALYDKYGPVEVTMPLAYDKAAYATRDAAYPGASWTFRPGVDPTTHIAVLSPPDPKNYSQYPDQVPSLDEAIPILRVGGDPNVKSDWVPASVFFAQH